MSGNEHNTPGFRLDGHRVPDPLCQRPAGSDSIILSTSQGEHGGADCEQRTEREVLVFDAATEDDAIHGLVSKRCSSCDETKKTH